MPKNSQTRSASILASTPAHSARQDYRDLICELISGLSGLSLALFMWGHMLLVGSILFGPDGFDWLASTLETFFIAQPTIVIIIVLFLVHALFAMRKVPAQLSERRAMFELATRLRSAPADWPGIAPDDPRLRPHLESWLWIWQVRTGLVMLLLGGAHLALISVDIFSPQMGEFAGIESATSMARVRNGLWLPYAILLLCVEFHAGVGLYRLAIKWGIGAKLPRHTLWRIEKFIFWIFLGLGVWILLVLAAWLSPPFEFARGG